MLTFLNSCKKALYLFAYDSFERSNGIITAWNYIQERYKMQRKIQLDDNFYRAIYLLQNRFHTPTDLLKYWAFAGPCDEGQPSIENIKKIGK